jgi:hypothetical protein
MVGANNRNKKERLRRRAPVDPMAIVARLFSLWTLHRRDITVDEFEERLNRTGVLEGLDAAESEVVVGIALAMERDETYKPTAIRISLSDQDEERLVAPEKATLAELLAWKKKLLDAFELFGNPNPLEDGPFGDERDLMYKWLVKEIEARQAAQ